MLILNHFKRGLLHETIPTHVDAKVYDIEQVRAAVMCGNYYETTHGPNIFMLMKGNLKSNSKGIETFVVGNWATERYSKISHDYFNRNGGGKVAGMPGCVIMDMCNNREIREEKLPIGRFRISEGRKDDYGMEDMFIGE